MIVKRKGKPPKLVLEAQEQANKQRDKTIPMENGAKCRECPLFQERIVHSQEAPDKKILFCGSTPSPWDINTNKLFSGTSDRILGYMLYVLKLGREDVGLTNTLLCVPSKVYTQKNLDKALSCCKPRLDAEVSQHSDIVACGDGPFNTLTGLNDLEMSDIHGQYYGKVLPTYGFRYAENRNPNIITVMAKDMYKVEVGANVIEEIKQVRIDTLSKLVSLVDHIMDRPQDRLVIDLETSHIDRIMSLPEIWWDQTILQMGICVDPGTAYIIPEKLIMTVEALDAIRPLLERNNLAGANFKFDVLILKGVYYRFFGKSIQIRIDEDTFIMSYVLDELSGRHSLKEHASYFNDRGYDDSIKKHITKKRDSYSQIPEQELSDYLAKDVDYTYRLVDVFKNRLTESEQYDWPYRNILIEAQNVFIEMEYIGVYTNNYKINSARNEVEPIVAMFLKEIKYVVGNKEFNPNSPKQLSKFLYEVCGLALPKSGKGKPSTDVTAITELLQRLEDTDIEESKAKQLLTVLSQYRKKFKLLTTYINKLEHFEDVLGWSHHSFNLARTVTGRLAGGILMTLPADAYGGPLIRGCFQAPPKVSDLKKEFIEVVESYCASREIVPIKSITLVKDNPNKGPNEPDSIEVIERPGDFIMLDADYSQAEVRTGGFLSQDDAIINVYLENKDIHSTIARFVFQIPDGEKVLKDQRRIAKTIVFGYLYGMVYTSLIGKQFTTHDGSYRVIDAQAAKEIFDAFETLVSGFKKWRDSQFAMLDREGEIYTPTRRKRRVPLVIDRMKSYVTNQAYNFPNQSFANDIALRATVKIHKFFREKNLPVWLNIYLHDGIYAICYNDKHLVEYATKNMQRLMQEAAIELQELNYGRYTGDYTKIPFKADIDLRVSWG